MGMSYVSIRFEWEGGKHISLGNKASLEGRVLVMVAEQLLHEWIKSGYENELNIFGYVLKDQDRHVFIYECKYTMKISVPNSNEGAVMHVRHVCTHNVGSWTLFLFKFKETRYWTESFFLLHTNSNGNIMSHHLFCNLPRLVCYAKCGTFIFCYDLGVSLKQQKLIEPRNGIKIYRFKP